MRQRWVCCPQLEASEASGARQFGQTLGHNGLAFTLGFSGNKGGRASGHLKLGLRQYAGIRIG